jgi:type III pantothenate kinase
MKENVLVIDIGNSNIVFGLYSKKLVKTHRINTDTKLSVDDYYRVYQSFFYGSVINKIVISSVVPKLSLIFEEIIQTYVKVPYHFVNYKTDLGLIYPQETADFLGSDLIVNAFSAFKKYKHNCVIVDTGTTTTIQLVHKLGEFLGYVILPGIYTSFQCLKHNASQLKRIKLDSEITTLLGKGTNEAISSGVINGHFFVIEEYLRRIKLEHSELKPIKTIITGGNAKLLLTALGTNVIFDDNLLLDGLFYISERIF